MSGALFEDVTDTALWVAAFRAIESERPDALFRDPFADRLAGERGRRLAAEVTGAKNFGWSIAVRTRMLDELIGSAVAGGVDTVVNLGAGLDARPYRLDLPPSLRWIEADQPKIIDLKEERLRGETPVCRLERVRIDLARAEARAALFADVDRGAARTLVLTEGVIGYLTTEDVASLASDLRAREHVRYWLADYSSPFLKKAMRRRRRVRQQFQNAPFKFDVPDWERFFREQGFRLLEMRYHVEEGERLGRPVPLPAWLRVLMAISPKSRKERIRHMMGFGLLEREGRA